VPETFDELLELLDLEELDLDLYRGFSPPGDVGRERVFGGQVAAQAMVAARRTVDGERRAHSLHGYFLRSGDPTIPIVYHVDRIRDGRSFTTRRVVANQKGKAIFNMAVSFQVPEQAWEHSFTMPEAPDPESMPTNAERMQALLGDKANPAILERLTRKGPVEIRFCDPPDWQPSEGEDCSTMVWLRVRGDLGDDPRVHTCAMVYASDYTLTSTVMRPHGLHWATGRVMSASLDHAMWFHADARADEWWLYVEDSPSASGARGLARGSIFAHDGRLVCSVAQEVLLRPWQGKGDGVRGRPDKQSSD